MNLILFEREELSGDPQCAVLPSCDLRSIHLKKILKAGLGTVFDAGIINGRQGQAVVEDIRNGEYHIIFTPGKKPEGLYPLTLILGLSRPPTVKKVLKEATALGVEEFILCGTENGEQSYRQSSLLQPEKIREVLIEGAQQAYCTILPEVRIRYDLKSAIESARNGYEGAVLAGLDNYEAKMSLTSFMNKTGFSNKIGTTGKRVILAVGSERGWTDKERKMLRESGFALVSLGRRVLRTETASIAGAALCLSGMGLI